MNLLFSKAQKVPATTVLEVDGAPVTIAVKVSARARSFAEIEA